MITFAIFEELFVSETLCLVTSDHPWYTLVNYMILHKSDDCIRFIISSITNVNHYVNFLIVFVGQRARKIQMNFFIWFDHGVQCCVVFLTRDYSKILTLFSAIFAILRCCPKSRCNYGCHTCFAASSFSPCPGCVRCSASISVALSCFGITTLSSFRMILSLTEMRSLTL